MKREKSLAFDARPVAFSRWIRILFLLSLSAGMVYCVFIFGFNCIDGCGPYHNRASTVDLDGDGDLDIVLSNLRHESDTIVWAGATLWINQGGGKFTPRSGDFGGPYSTAGDVDGDGDIDLVRWGYNVLEIHLNYGEEGPLPGGFGAWYGISPEASPTNRSAAVNGSIALGDLNGDGRLDAFVSKCCATLIDNSAPFLPWVWINTPDESGYPRGVGSYLNSLGDLPMRPTLGDLDGDGDLDVYAASLPPRGSEYDTADRVLLNDGNGNFVDSGQRLENDRLPGTAGSGAVALGDLDGDNDLDALVATSSGAAIWINQGGAQDGQAGIFSDSDLRLGHDHVEDVFLADLDADGDPDAVVGEKALATVWLESVTSDGKAQASIWLNEGQAGLRDSGQRLRYTEHHGMAVGDFNGDGYLDVFAVPGNLWLNQGDGRLQKRN